jgi:hypothetical protein
MSDVKVILGPSDLAWEPALRAIAAQPVWRPWDERAVRFVTRLSQRLLTLSSAKAHPEMMALGHWFRGASLKDMSRRWSERADPDTAVVGRGLAFHVAPANVDSMFMYSWLISLLAGNTNVVRVSQAGSPVSDTLVRELGLLLLESPDEPVAERLLLLNYGHVDAVTARISESCQVRVVWGGDETVKHLRSLPLNPTAVELCFPDRFSLAAVAASKVLALDQEALTQLVARFYQDTFWFGQQACSSPRMLVWVGDDAAVLAAQAIFWPALYAAVERKRPEDTPAMGMARLVASFEFAATGLASPVEPAAHRLPERLASDRLRPEMHAFHTGNGLFLEQRLDRLEELSEQLSAKEQTLSVFGFDRAEIMGLVNELPARAIDRIVPVGTALNFAWTWDGNELIDAFTRRITLPPETNA